MIYNIETERRCIAGALRHPDILSEVSFFVKEEDFKPGANRTIYSAILDATSKGEDVSSFRIAEKLKNAGITLPDLDISPEDYLDDIRLITVTEKATVEFFKELKKTSIRRDFYNMADNIKQMMVKSGNMSVDELIEWTDKEYSKKLSVFEQSSENMFEDVFGDLEEQIEERGNNPILDYGVKGPFSRVNEIYGSLLRRGNINLVAARQNQGKTQLGMFYMMHILKNYNVPVFHLDMGEMSRFELQVRMMTLMTNGLVSPDLLETGKWRKNPETERLVRSAWPEVKKLTDKYFYQDVSELSPDQMMAVIKRFFLSKVKHRNFRLEDMLEFIIFYDYIKAFENNDGGDAKFKQEYQLMGYFLQKIKRLIQKVLPAALWTSLQVNRMGITGNKNVSDIDNTENVFSMSDRLVQQATHAELLRQLTAEELDMYPGAGNYMLNFVKARHLGSDRDAHLNNVRMPDRSLRKNFIFLEAKNFMWREMGDLKTLKDKFGVANMHTHHDDDGDNLPPDVPRKHRENVDLD